MKKRLPYIGFFLFFSFAAVLLFSMSIGMGRSVLTFQNISVAALAACSFIGIFVPDRIGKFFGTKEDKK